MKLRAIIDWLKRKRVEAAPFPRIGQRVALKPPCYQPKYLGVCVGLHPELGRHYPEVLFDDGTRGYYNIIGLEPEEKNAEWRAEVSSLWARLLA